MPVVGPVANLALTSQAFSAKERQPERFTPAKVLMESPEAIAESTRKPLCQTYVSLKADAHAAHRITTMKRSSPKATPPIPPQN